MDKSTAIDIGKKYIQKVLNNNIHVIEAWLFGSYAKGNQREDSDIDIALVIPEKEYSFDTDVKLMTIRQKDELLIEPHTYTPNEFATVYSPIVSQIKMYGERI